MRCAKRWLMVTMTDQALSSKLTQFKRQGLPVAVMLLALLLAWYVSAWWLNAPGAIERVLPEDGAWTWQDLLSATMAMERPLLPAPHQVALDFWSSLVDWPLNSPRNLMYHVAVTAESTLWGFVMGTMLGLVLSVCIVHSRTLDRALLPWIVASQTVPVLAIAPIVLVILGTLGFAGVAPKAVIAMYLSFFPVTVAMVQGLRSPQVIETEMMHTYAASRWQALWLLRLPAADRHCRQSGRGHGGRTTNRSRGRPGRAPANRFLLRQHGADLVGPGDVGLVGPGAHCAGSTC